MARIIVLLLFPILALPDRVGWVSSPNVRGTSDILWSCGAIFLVCTWKCMHFNLPSYEESEAQWHTLWGWVPYWPTRLRWRVIIHLMKWMCTIALAPELGIAMAADEFWQAWKLKKRVGSSRFTLTHAFYALMGGFVIAVPVQTDGNSQPNEAKMQATTTESGQAPSKYLQNLEYFSVNSRTPPPTEDEFTEGPLFFPRVTEDDIKNQAKSDPLTKAFAILQCMWLIVQSIARTSRGLPLSELELTALAFTLCAFIMYVFWWCKPFDAQRPTRVLCLDPETVAQILSNLVPWNIQARTPNTEHIGDYFFSLLDLPHDRLSSRTARSMLFHTSAVAFSAIHLIAWNWQFPSPAVRIMWRSFSLGAICIPLAGIFLISIVTIMPLFYGVCRLGLVVLIFYCFSSMPASVYEATSWHSVFPHFS
ncbi:hypothetical protein BJX65DRAFT_321536 [Aspergillus insuetus]